MKRQTVITALVAITLSAGLFSSAHADDGVAHCKTKPATPYDIGFFKDADKLDAAIKPTCKVTLHDSLNKFTTHLEAHVTKPLNGEAEAYEVINHRGKKHPGDGDIAYAGFPKNDGELVCDLGVPHQPKSQILAEYAAMTAKIKAANGKPVTEDNGQLTWTVEGGSECSDTDLSLIQFFVMEWFYFG